ncbi:hypothetical protein J0692_04655 [Vibrio alginolyticus]|uniref:hypothetical protein n=1 Tax=Vibrio alginolyticus TaxID=663 RepID=UPI001A8FE488|nr:hypothetical protein [Vibrio alginolyticus]MBO0161517.1 hypothetical protein [Vibrio alginolyticus]
MPKTTSQTPKERKISLLITFLKGLVLLSGGYLLTLNIMLIRMENATPSFDLIGMLISLIPSYFVLGQIKQILEEQPSAETQKLFDYEHPDYKIFLSRYFLIYITIFNKLVLSKKIKSHQEKIGEDVHKEIMKKHVDTMHLHTLKVMKYIPITITTLCMMVFVDIDLKLTGNVYLDYFANEYVEGFLESLISLFVGLIFWASSYAFYIKSLVKLYNSKVNEELQTQAIKKELRKEALEEELLDNEEVILNK